MRTIQVMLTDEQYEHVLALATAAECSEQRIIQAMIDVDRKGVTVKHPKAVLSVPRMQDRDLLVKTLMENDGNVSQTARELGEHRRTVQRKIIRYGIAPWEFEPIIQSKNRSR